MKPMKEYRNSDVGAVRQFQQLSANISPSRALNEQEMVYFKAIINSRAVDTWNEYDIMMATDMAGIMYQRDVQAERLHAEGFTVPGATGNIVKHPLVGVVYMLSQQVMALTKALGLTAPQRGLNTPEAKNKNATDKAKREQIAAAAGHDLLASAVDD